MTRLHLSDGSLLDVDEPIWAIEAAMSAGDATMSFTLGGSLVVVRLASIVWMSEIAVP